jgi:hypothetical protein
MSAETKTVPPFTHESTDEAYKALNVFIAEYTNKHGSHEEMSVALLVTTAQLRAGLGDVDEELVEASKSFIQYRAARAEACEARTDGRTQ